MKMLPLDEYRKLCKMATKQIDEMFEQLLDLSIKFKDLIYIRLLIHWLNLSLLEEKHHVAKQLLYKLFKYTEWKFYAVCVIHQENCKFRLRIGDSVN